MSSSKLVPKKFNEFTKVTDPTGCTFAGYNGTEDIQIDFSNMIPLFGVVNEEGQSTTLASSQRLVSGKADKQNIEGDEVLYLPNGSLPEPLQNIQFIQNVEYVIAAVDTSNQVLFGVHWDGSFYMPIGLPSELSYTLRSVLNDNFAHFHIDADGKLLFAIDKEGKFVFSVDQLSNIDFRPIIKPIIAENVRINSDAQKNFLFSYFREDDQSMYLAISDGGKDWIDFGANNGKVYSNGGNIRDPSIIKLGIYFYATYTRYTKVDGNLTMMFEIIRSSDLQDWTIYKQYFIPELADMKHIWAPELSLINGKIYVILSATTDTGAGVGFQTYLVELDSDFNYVSTNKIDFGISNTIDAVIQYMDGRYIAIVKDETNKTLRVYTSSSLLDGYTMTYILPETWIEGPALVKYNSMYRIYYDTYLSGLYSYIESKDLKVWNTPVRLVSNKFRHGSVILLDFIDSHLVKNLHFKSL